jgi:hypothetical protein
MIACALIFTSCDDPEEEVAGDQTGTPGPLAVAETSTASTSLAPSQSPAPSATISATPGTDWNAAGISLRYPPDLAVGFESPGAHNEYGGWDVDIRSPETLTRAFVVSTFEANPYNQTLDEFADFFYCARDKREATLAGAQARRCVKDSLNIVEWVIVAERDGKFYAISAIGLTAEEFEAILNSFLLLNAK